MTQTQGRIDYEVSGAGPTVVLVPGSCSTGAAWRPLMAAWDNRFRCVTTSLLGYGATAERRSQSDPSIWHEADAVEEVVRKAGGRVHLVGHSFGGLVAVAVALRKRVSLASLVVIEAPAVGLLWKSEDRRHYHAFRRMTESYFAAYAAGDAQAIAAMIDFYGGAGTFASWPPRVRDYATATTAVNLLDWASAYGFAPSPVELAAVKLPVLVLCGEDSHPAVRRANERLAAWTSGTGCTTIADAAHFMIATHAEPISELIADHVRGAELRGRILQPAERTHRSLVTG